MNIEELKQFVKQAGRGYLATTDGKIVGVRPMGGLAWKDNQLLCATFNPSDKVSQLKKVPYAEYCFCDSTGKHVRIAGPCTISTDNDEKLWLFNQVPELAKYFPDPAAPQYVIIKMIPDNIRVISGKI
ncbi:MAG: pyridoxamine 5'-phosphate oxidase family protein [Phycisphaerae bacterium]|nr:pyridoxamine 5'-phosphate oxidase family protein [Phycisphaerae bacterium]